jgi:hypothetical protein
VLGVSKQASEWLAVGDFPRGADCRMRLHALVWVVVFRAELNPWLAGIEMRRPLPQIGQLETKSWLASERLRPMV